MGQQHKEKNNINTITSCCCHCVLYIYTTTAKYQT